MNVQNVKNISQFEDKSLLIVDDDNPFRERLARAMEIFQQLLQQSNKVQSIILLNQLMPMTLKKHF